MPGLIDALVSDPYEIGTPQTLALRGSDNQRLHYLTPLGERRFAQFDRVREQGDMRLDLMFHEDGSVSMAGIPRADDLRELRRRLAAAGHVVQTSQAR